MNDNDEMKRALRRHHIARLKAKRRSYWGYGRVYRVSETSHVVLEMNPKQLGQVAQCPQMCSCLGCGNQRRYVGRTLAEVVHEIMLDEFIKQRE